MKITTGQLRGIIREEVARALRARNLREMSGGGVAPIDAAALVRPAERPQRVIAQWSLVSKQPDEDGELTRLRVVRHADGTGNVYLMLPDGSEEKLYRDETEFRLEPRDQLRDANFEATRIG